MFQLTSAPVLPDVVVIFFSLIVVTPDGLFLLTPLLHSVSDTTVLMRPSRNGGRGFDVYCHVTN